MVSVAVDIRTLIQTGTLETCENTKLVQKLRNNFSESEQKLYICNLFLYLNHNSMNEFIINLENVWKFIGFSNKANAKRLLKHNFKDGTDYQVLLIRSDEQVHGGHNTETILLNINTFKKLCLKANTKESDKIHDYYIKLESIYNETMKEELEENKKQLEEKNQLLLQKDTDHELNLKLNKQKILLEKFSNKKCVYLCEIELNLIKIGSSKDICQRNANLQAVFKGINADRIIYLDAFECNFDFREIEQEILSNEFIKNNLYREPINGHISKEVVLLNEMFNYKQLVTIVNDIINNRANKEIETRRLENETKKLDLIKTLLDQGVHFDKIESLLNGTVSEKVHTVVPAPNPPVLTPTVTQRGRKIQMINKDNLNVIVRVFDSMIHVLRDPNDHYDKQAVQFAINNRTIYKNHRWAFVEHGHDPSVVHSIGDTVDSKLGNVSSTIVMLNSERTEILNTFSGITKIRKFLKVSLERAHKIIDENLLFQGAFFVHISKVKQEHPELLQEYQRNNIIDRVSSAKAMRVKQTNTKDLGYVIVYNSIAQASILFGSGESTISKAIKTKTLIRGYRFEKI